MPGNLLIYAKVIAVVDARVLGHFYMPLDSRPDDDQGAIEHYLRSHAQDIGRF